MTALNVKLLFYLGLLKVRFMFSLLQKFSATKVTWYNDIFISKLNASQVRVFGGLSLWLSSIDFVCQAVDTGWIPESGRSPGEGNGNPLQYSCMSACFKKLCPSTDDWLKKM